VKHKIWIHDTVDEDQRVLPRPTGTTFKTVAEGHSELKGRITMAYRTDRDRLAASVESLQT
jgi:hypothetical protein